MNTSRLIITGTLTLLLVNVTAASFAEEFPPGNPPWYSYGKKPEGNNPYDFSGDRSSFPNPGGGYAGSELPPSQYNPDRPRFPENDRTAPMPPLDGGRYSGQANPYCTGELCGR